MNDKKPSAPRSLALAHARETTRREAEHLLTSAGSSEQAQRAVESAVGLQKGEGPRNDAFARQWNFGSYLEMFEASKPLSTVDGKHWLATNTGGDRWIVWNDEDLIAAYTVGSVEEAQELLGAPDKQTEDAAPPTG